jgi:hypothetical protein
VCKWNNTDNSNALYTEKTLRKDFESLFYHKEIIGGECGDTGLKS